MFYPMLFMTRYFGVLNKYSKGNWDSVSLSLSSESVWLVNWKGMNSMAVLLDILAVYIGFTNSPHHSVNWCDIYIQ